MNAAEWDAGRDSGPLLSYLIAERAVQRTKIGRRRLRLFAVACGRRVEALVRDPQLRALLPAAEACADGAITAKRLAATRPEHPPNRISEYEALPPGVASQAERDGQCERELLAALVLWKCACPGASFDVSFHSDTACVFGSDRYKSELAVQADFLRDIFGNPFRPIALSKTWRTTAAVGLARSMYDSRDFSPMPILADALEDAGCDNAEVLSHCRGERQHVRGCWVVDWVLNEP